MDFSQAAQRLEFQSILDIVSRFTESLVARSIIASHLPAQTREESDRFRNETLESASLIETGVSGPGKYLDALGNVVELISEGTILLSGVELRSAGSALLELSRFSSTILAQNPEYLLNLIKRIPVFDKLGKDLLRATTPDGKIASDATPELAGYTRKVEKLRKSLLRNLEKISRELGRDGVLRDSPVTIRNGRYVLPVLASRKKSVSGIVHDRSETGQTVFIEPFGIVENGNSFQEAVLEVEVETRRIRRDLTSCLRQIKNELTDGLEAAAELDFIFARAGYHRNMVTTFPDHGRLRLLKLKHPLISPDEVIANDIILPDDWLVLVISGPNAGGKTVLMKALGLAVFCSQSGLGISAADGSSMPFYRNMMVTMGDQQSIEDHMSTYSARLNEQLLMMKNLGSKSLALIDEPAAGTDPSAGAALASAVIENLVKKDCRLVVSTHMSQLKKMASGRKGFINGSMSFDIESLKPDYLFILGTPGSSYALEIAKRMGFSKSVIDRAEELASETFRVEKLLEELENQKLLQNKETAVLRKKLEMTEKTEIELRIEKEQFEKQREKTLSELKNSTEKLLEDLGSKADSLLVKLSRVSVSDRSKVRREIRDYQRKESLVINSYNPQKKVSQVEISCGSWVTVKGWTGVGMVERIHHGKALISFSNLKLERSLNDLSSSTAPEKEFLAGWDCREEKPEIHLRGLTSEEAEVAVDNKIDDCIFSEIPYLRIIHGKGKGILLRVVIDILKRDRRVIGFRQGEPSEGGEGVTIAALKVPRIQG